MKLRPAGQLQDQQTADKSRQILTLQLQNQFHRVGKNIALRYNFPVCHYSLSLIIHYKAKLPAQAQYLHQFRVEQFIQTAD